jgi:hypothetical protein
MINLKNRIRRDKNQTENMLSEQDSITNANIAHYTRTAWI